MDFERLEEEYFKFKDDTLAFIKFYETNLESIEKLDDKDEEQNGFKLKMNGDYGLCLATSGNTEKAVKVLETFIPRFEKESGLSETEIETTPYYEHLLWALGSSLYYTDNIEKTQRTFERLTKLQPDNQKYKNWLKGTIEKKFSKFRKASYVFIFSWFLVDILFIKSMDIGLKGVFLISGGLIVIGTISLETYVYYLKKKIG